MKKIYFILVVLIGLTTGLTGAKAESAGTTGNAPENRPILNAVKEVRNERQNFITNTVRPAQQEMKDTRQNTLEDIKTERQNFITNATTTLKSASKEDRPVVRAELETQRQQLQADIKTKRAALQQEMDQKHQELQAQRKTFQEEARKKIADSITKKISQTLDNMTKAVDRILDINSRIQTRITKLQELSINTTEAQIALDDANQKVNAASVAIDMAKSTIADASNATSTDVLSFKAVLQTTENAVRTAREATGTAINILKGLVPKTATSTPENN